MANIKQSLYWLKIDILIKWRLIRNRCLLCGGKKENHTNCYHCSVRSYCHWCGKSKNHAANYGIGNYS